MSNGLKDNSDLVINYPFEELKKLYFQKISAIKNKDYAFLDQLRIDCPQLFDKKFLYQMLLIELEIQEEELPEHVHNILKKAINETHVKQ